MGFADAGPRRASGAGSKRGARRASVVEEGMIERVTQTDVLRPHKLFEHPIVRRVPLIRNFLCLRRSVLQSFVVIAAVLVTVTGADEITQLMSRLKVSTRRHVNTAEVQKTFSLMLGLTGGNLRSTRRSEEQLGEGTDVAAGFG